MDDCEILTCECCGSIVYGLNPKTEFEVESGEIKKVQTLKCALCMMMDSQKADG